MQRLRRRTVRLLGLGHGRGGNAGRLHTLFENFDAIGASGKKAACFASGDSSFEHFCGAVDVIENRLSGLGAVIMEEGLKVDGDYSGNKDDVDAWCDRIIEDL